MTIAPEKRSGAMKAVITGEQMQMELLELLQSLPDDLETEAFQTIVMKVNLLVVFACIFRTQTKIAKLYSRG